MARERYDVTEKVIFITGGARGIGADAAQRLVRRGARVALMDVNSELVERTTAELGDQAIWFAGDVTDVDDLETAVAQTVDHFGGIDVVVANAGISGKPQTVLSIDPADFERVIEINLLGVWRTVRAALPHVIERQGYVLPIASVAAILPVPLAAAYGASKSGVEGFARALRMEIAHTNTRVGVGYYSFIDTDMVRDAFADPLIEIANKAVPSFLRRPLPVGAAGEAIARGIERRALRVYAPRWVPWLIRGRGAVDIGAQLAARNPRLRKAARAADAAAREQAAARERIPS